MTKKLTQEEAIRTIQDKFGDVCDYSLSNYIDSQTKIKIRCKVHDYIYEQVYNDHKRSKYGGCPMCCDERQSKERLPPKEFFTNKLISLRDDRGTTYDYTSSVYRGARKEVNIVCKKHGVFWQLPQVHYRNGGCQQCANDASSESRFLTQEEFEEKAKTEHGDKYDYSVSIYRGYKEYVDVLCKEHGVFSVLVSNHLSGQGCQMCTTKGFQNSKDSVLYIILTDTFVGFGVSNDFSKRLKDHDLTFRKSLIPYSVHTTYTGLGGDIKRLESKIKRHFKKYIINTGLDGFKTEALPLYKIHDLLSYIKENLPGGRFIDT